MICYHFSLKVSPKERLLVEEYSLSPSTSGLIFNVFMDRKIFGDVDYYSTFLHGQKTSKLFDSMFTPKRFYFLIPNATYDFMNIDTTFSSVRINYLPPPYDTACRNIDGHISATGYYFTQLRKKVQDELHLVDTFTPVYEPSQYPLLGMEYLINQTFLAELNRIRKSVKRPPPVCNIEYYVSRLTLGASTNIVISVYWPEEYATNVEYFEDQGWIDYIVYICSSIGIWFGLSFCSLLNLSDRFLKKTENRTTSAVRGRDTNAIKLVAMFKYFKLVTNEMKKEINLLKSKQEFLSNRSH